MEDSAISVADRVSGNFYCGEGPREYPRSRGWPLKVVAIGSLIRRLALRKSDKTCRLKINSTVTLALPRALARYRYSRKRER